MKLGLSCGIESSHCRHAVMTCGLVAGDNGCRGTKLGRSGGLGKAKAVAMAGAQKVKNGTSMGIKWVKNKCQKKNNTSSA
nr:ankyrin repeat domain-containing protein 13C-B [Ipomoea batatas]